MVGQTRGVRLIEGRSLESLEAGETRETDTRRLDMNRVSVGVNIFAIGQVNRGGCLVWGR